MNKREEGLEKKFAHDEELRFKATARRSKLVGLWAAAKLGLTGAAAEAYTKDVVAADLEHPGERECVGQATQRLQREGRSRHRRRDSPGDERIARESSGTSSGWQLTADGTRRDCRSRRCAHFRLRLKMTMVGQREGTGLNGPPPHPASAVRMALLVPASKLAKAARLSVEDRTALSALS